MGRYFFSLLCFLALTSCSSSKKNELKIAASAMPHAQILEYVKPELHRKGINLVVVVTDDYNMPNRALADHEVDANFFQHIPFLDEQIQQFHYPIQSLVSIEIEPMGIYSKKIRHLSDLQDGAHISLPNDPTNEARALLLLQNAGLIQLDNPNNLQATTINIISNPKQLTFIEIDPAMLPRSLEDVDAAAINTNYALQANLAPLHDALILEDKNSPYANVIAIRDGEKDRPELVALKEAMTSEQMKAFIQHTYKGAVIPAF